MRLNWRLWRYKEFWRIRWKKFKWKLYYGRKKKQAVKKTHT